jgi:beta-glucosidase
MSVMKSYGANTYRFSLAWARIIPLGGRDDPINEKGIAFYNSVIDECLKLGMTPFITLYQFVSSQCNIPELM